MEALRILALEALRALVALQELSELADEVHVEDQRRWWVHPINVRRNEFGASEHLVQEMRLTDDEEFFNFTRLTLQQFDELLALVGPSIKKQTTREDVISPYTRLLITLRYSNQVIQNN